jgi:hypothetical protein
MGVTAANVSAAKERDMGRRLKMSPEDYREIIESRDWCAKNGCDGMVRWYGEYLDFHMKRRTLPPEALVGLPEEDDRPGREWRDRESR